VTVRVLVVDDQVPYRQAMSAVVRALTGFVVVGEASAGEDALVQCATLHPDLVLMDVNLGGMDGIEAARRIRASSKPPVVILLSTYDAEEGEGQLQACGAAGYIPKADLAPDRLTAMWESADR
jgi:DNA-binding NarL/FixJ family response regulator